MAFAVRAALLCSTLVLLRHACSCGEEPARSVVSCGTGRHLAPRLTRVTRLGLRGGSEESTGAGPTRATGASEDSQPCSCCESDCPHAPAARETPEAAHLRVKRETVERHIERIERGEPLGLEHLPRDIVQDLSKALADGRMAHVTTAATPWWMLHPFGNATSQDSPEKAARSAAAGASVEETRAELTHNGGHSACRGWRPTETAESGVRDRWGLLWAQDAEQVVISFPVPSPTAAARVHVELLEGGRRLQVRVDTCLLFDDDLWRAVRCPGEEEGFDSWWLVHLDGLRLLKVALDKRRPPRQRHHARDDGSAAAGGECEASRALWAQLLLCGDDGAQDDERVCRACLEDEEERYLPIDKIRVMHQRPPNCPRVVE